MQRPQGGEIDINASAPIEAAVRPAMPRSSGEDERRPSARRFTPPSICRPMTWSAGTSSNE
ncbi:MAG: hypothetical protein R2716_00115 [Microthrixaceae bacterium]